MVLGDSEVNLVELTGYLLKTNPHWPIFELLVTQGLYKV